MEEGQIESMSPVKPIRSFSVAILNQKPILATTEVENNNRSNSIEPIAEMKTTNKNINQQKPKSQKRFRCDICGKAFNRTDHVKRHRLIHTGEKPFKCDICDKAFNRSFNVSQHRLIHTDEKPFKCDLCSQAFNNKSNLNRHRGIIHTGEKS